jgi:hypothetical protein
MTAQEKERMRIVARKVERLHQENAVLKLILEDHVPRQQREKEYQRLMASERIAAHIHTKLQPLYDGIDSTADLSKVLEGIALGTPIPDKLKAN